MKSRYACAGAIALVAALPGCGRSVEAASEGSCLTAVPETTIGGIESFHRVSGLAWGAEGTLFVLDGGDKHLYAFDATGRELWKRGREGSGPGELRNPVALTHRAGMLAVTDMGNFRVSLWTPIGDALPAMPLSEFSFGGGWPGTATPLSTEHILATVMPPRNPSSTDASHGAIVVASRGSSVADTVSTFVFPAPQIVQTTAGRFPVFPPFAVYPQVTATGDGDVIYTSRSGDYTIEQFTRAGQLLRTLRGPREALPLTAADRERAARDLPAGVQLTDVLLPTSLPAIAGFRISYEGDLLVQTNFRDGELVRWDRWERSGRYRDSFMLPIGFTLVTLQAERLAVRQTDSLDVPFVGIYRLEGYAPCIGPLPSGERP